jgi:hypothetical protein
MQLRTIGAVAVALLVVSTGAVAALPNEAADSAHEHADDEADRGPPADAPRGPPDDRGEDGAADGDDENETEDEDANEDADPSESVGDDGDRGNATDSDGDNGADDRSGPAVASARSGDAARGPPADLPASVPDHARAIHDLIRSMLGGDRNGAPGPAVSDVAGNGR